VNESFAYLGLRTDADERAVKRAYAQRLKQIRPEDDPAGFQTLHEHYRLALDQARQQTEAALIETSGGETASVPQGPSEPRGEEAFGETTVRPPSEALTAAQAPPAAPPAFDLDAFVQALFARVGDDDAGKLRDWLQSIDAFWSLALKNHAGHVALQSLANNRVAVRSELFDVILGFFDFDNALSGYDHFAIGRLRSALQLQYELQEAHGDVLTQRMRNEGSFDSAQTRSMLGALRRPFESWRNYVRALPPGRPSSMVRFIQILSRGQPDLLCPPIDPLHLRFWYASADRGRFMLPRVLLGYLRIIAAIIPAAAILYAFTLFAPTEPSKRPEQSTDVVVFFAWAFAWLVVLWTAWLIWLAALRWQASPEDGRFDRNAIARLLFIPAIAAAAGTACAYSTYAWQLNTGLAVAIIGALLSVLRFWRRGGFRFPKINLGGMSWAAMVVIANLSRMLFQENSHASSSYRSNMVPDSEEWQARAFIGIVLAVVAGLAWLVDLILQRHRFRQSATNRRH
jgi:hypothetical protein